MAIQRRRAKTMLLGCLLAALSLLVTGCGSNTSVGPAQGTSPAALPTNAVITTPKQAAVTPSASTMGGSPKGKGTARPPLSAGPTAGSAYMIVQSGPLLVAATEGGGVLASRDQGAHWQPMNYGLPPAPSSIALAAAPGIGRLLALVSGQIYATRPTLPFAWTLWGRRLPRGANPEALAFWPRTHTVLVGDGSGALYASSTTTAEWQPADEGLPVDLQAITTLLVHPDSIYAGLTNGLAMSTDGRRWTLDAGLGAHPVSGLCALPGGGLAASLDVDGVAIRPGAGALWMISAPTALGLPAGTRILSVAYDTHRRWLIIGTQVNGLRSLPGGRPPGQALGGVPAGDPINGLFPVGDRLLAATNAGILRLPLR